METSLRARLARLRPTPTAPDARLAELVARLERLRGRARHATARDSGALAARLGGRLAAPGLIVIERRYPLWHRHGRHTLARLARAEGALAPWDGAGAPLLIDTETTGLAGGTGTLAFLVGLGTIDPQGVLLRQWLITRYAAESEMLRALASAVPGDATLVSYNGKSFDLPLLATRFRLAALVDPFAGRAHVDLLHALRRRHGAALPDYRLRTVETQLLGYERHDDLPGAQAPGAWRALLRQGEATPIEAVLRHNRADLVSLAALLAAPEPAAPALARPVRAIGRGVPA